MTRWLRRIRAAVGMGLIWGVGWAIVGGAIMEGIMDPHGRILDMLSLSRFGALGAGTGLLLGVVAAATGPASLPLWLRAAVVIAPLTILSAASATASLALARLAERRSLPAPGTDDAEVRLPGGGD